MADDTMQVAVGRVDELKYPVHQLHHRIAAQLAERRRTFRGFVGHGIQLLEQRRTIDLSHAWSSVMPLPAVKFPASVLVRGRDLPRDAVCATHRARSSNRASL